MERPVQRGIIYKKRIRTTEMENKLLGKGEENMQQK